VYGWRWPKGLRCPECGYAGYCELAGRGLYPCHRCHHQTSLISGTLFEYTKLPLTTWFLGIYILTQLKNGTSVLELKRQLGISYNTAWRLKHKRMQAMKEHDDSQPLSGNVQMDDACLGGERPGGKRGRGAAGKTPFSDGLSCFASVTTAGCTHEAIVTGGGPASVNQEAPGRGGIDPADTRAALLDILP